MTDTTDVQLFAVKRNSPTKGFKVAVFPGAPAGREVVLDLQGRANAEGDYAKAADAQVKILNEGDVDQLAYMVVEVCGVALLMDLETASEICDALRFHEMSERHEAKEQS